MGTSIMIARRLGPELRGYYGLVLMAASLVAAFGHFGVGAAISYHTGKKSYPPRDVLSFVTMGSLALGTVLAAIFFLGYPVFPRVWAEIPRSVMLIGLLSVPFTFLSNFLQRFLLGLLRVKQSNLTRLLHSAIYFLCILIIVWLLGGGLLEVVVCYSVSIILSSILSLGIFTRDIRPFSRLKASMFGPFVKYGFQVYLVFVFNYLNHRFDIILIKHFLTASDVSFYQIPVNICEKMWQVPNAMASILFPTLLAMDRGSGGFTAKVSRINFAIMLVVGTVITALAGYFVPILYGQEYLPMLPAFYSVIWGIVISPVATFLGVYFASRKQISKNIVASLSGFACNIVLNLIMIPRMGIVGAGIATSISNTVWALILAWYFTRQEKIGFHEVFVLKKGDIREVRDKLAGALSRWKNGPEEEE
jgi:O-antigen/teichoic acid export membrane protein